jgi:acetyl esterase
LEASGSSERDGAAAAANITGFIFLEKGHRVVVLGWWNGTRDVLIERAEGSRVVRPFRGLRKPREDPYRVALEAERRADLLRAEAGLPPAITFAVPAGEGPVRRGPKARHPERAALSTFWDIGQLRRLSLILAHGDLPSEEREAILASLPAELQEDFRSIMGRHRRYGRRQTLSRAAVNELVKGIAYCRDLLNREPADRLALTPKEMSEFDYVVKLHSVALGPSIAGTIDSDGLATRDIPVLEGPAAPAYVRGLWKRLDSWGAASHEVTLPTFRSWRTKLRKAGLLGTPPPRGRAKRVRDN